MQTIESGYTLPEVTSPTPKDINDLLEEKKRQKEVLNRTNSSNYRDLAKEEALDKKKLTKDGFFSRFFKRLVD